MDLVTPLTDLVDALEAADVSATLVAADVNAPAAWVTLDETRRAVLGGQWTLGAVVYLIVPDTDTLRSLELLGAMLDKVSTVLTPDGPVTTQGVVLPGDPTPLPALRVPVNLTTT